MKIPDQTDPTIRERVETDVLNDEYGLRLAKDLYHALDMLDRANCADGEVRDIIGRAAAEMVLVKDEFRLVKVKR